MTSFSSVYREIMQRKLTDLQRLVLSVERKLTAIEERSEKRLTKTEQRNVERKILRLKSDIKKMFQ